jgi:hypothetical protein
MGPASGGPDPQNIGFRRRMAHRQLLRAFHTASSPLGPEGRSLMENTPFSGFSAGLRLPNHLAAVGRIMVFGGLAAISPEHEFGELLNRQRFEAKRPGYASHEFRGPTSICRCGMEPTSGGPDPQDMPLFPPPPLSRR